MKFKSFKSTCIALKLLLLLGGLQPAKALNSAFTYSGMLYDNGAPAAGPYDFKFTLHDAVANTPPLGNLLQDKPNIAVAGGMFTVTLDFGAAYFTGQTLWLEMSVRKAGIGVYVVQSPRQQIRPVPYAMYAEKAGSLADNATLLGGVTFAPASGPPFAVGPNNAQTVVNLSADKLDGLDSTAFWKLSGNASTPAGAFLGTTDSQPLELKVHSARALRIEDGDSPNLIGGYKGNYVKYGVVGATIAGGGFSPGIFVSAQTNTISADFGTISGGMGNLIKDYADATTIGGGYANTIQTAADYATIPGGRMAEARNYGQLAYASGRFATNGDAQTSLYVLRRKTSGAGSWELFLDGLSQRMKIPRGATWTFDMLVVARATNGVSGGYQLRGVVENNRGTISLIGNTAKTVLGEENSLWDVFVSADAAHESLAINVQGETFSPQPCNGLSVPISWVASVRTVEALTVDGITTTDDSCIPK